MRGVEERPAGLVYRPEFLETDTEVELLGRMCELRMEPVVMHGVASRRLVRHFGTSYDVESWDTGPTEPIPDFLLDLRSAAAALAGVEAVTFAEALVTRYPPEPASVGTGTPPRSDRSSWACHSAATR